MCASNGVLPEIKRGVETSPEKKGSGDVAIKKGEWRHHQKKRGVETLP